ncbi:MAG: BolA family protein [Caulobacteraceae bacterium]|nr:BolA family protein [Caulobacteraceae bacterium]
MGAVADEIRQRLEADLSPGRLEVIDDSDRHHGHAGAREGGESHFTVIVESAAFAGLGRLARQRLVNQSLKAALAGPVHALSIKALAPGETE